MKSIELTEKHKEKLLEMFKTLFPEYKYWNLHDGTCDLCTENTLDYSLEEKPQLNSLNRISWFEFCMTHLSKKIFDDVKKNYYSNDITSHCYHMGDVLNSKTHPIDYLYDEFKKLEL